MISTDQKLIKELLVELKAARGAITKMKAECTKYDEGYSIGRIAIKRINNTLNSFTNNWLKNDQP